MRLLPFHLLFVFALLLISASRGANSPPKAAAAVTNNSTGTSSVEAEEEEEEEKLDAEWSCGTDDFSKFLAQSTVDRDCPERKNAINNCCVAHDKCYDEQLGRTHCDDVFCDCLESASSGSEMCLNEDAPYFCNLVRQFGESFYNASAKLDGKSPIVPESVNGKKQTPKLRQQRSVRFG